MAQPAITMGGAPEGFDARLVLKEVETSGGPVLHVARDDKRMEAMRAALAFFAPVFFLRAAMSHLPASFEYVGEI